MPKRIPLLIGKKNAAEHAAGKMEQEGEHEPPCRALLRERVMCPQCSKTLSRKTLLYKHATTCRSLADRRAAYDAQMMPQETTSQDAFWRTAVLGGFHTRLMF